MSIMLEEILSQSYLLQRCYCDNVDNIYSLAEAIRKRNIDEIVIVARGSSRNACEYFKYLCEVYCNLCVSFCYPSAYTKYNALPKVTNALYLAVSQGGKGEDINYVISKVRDSGGLTIAFTNDPASQLAHNAEYHVCLSVDKEKSMAATKTFSAEMLLLGMFAYALAGKDLQVFSQVGRLCAVDAVQNGQILSAVSQLQNVNSLFVLARGYCYAVAKEFCCKLQETCFINANGYAHSDFMHGPFALIDVNSTVVLFASADATITDSTQMLVKLKDNDAKIILVTNDYLLAQQYGGIYCPCEEPILTPFAFTITAQLIAEKISSLKGINPDVSRNLNKYTKTL